MNKLVQILVEFWQVMGEMSPYLLLGFFLAGILYVFIPTDFVEKHLGGKGFLPIFKAAILGVPLPLCSCGVIPVSASLRRNKASRGATTSFLISTPETGVDSILVTYSLLGPVFAIFRPVMALINGIIGGTFVELLVKEKEIQHIEDKAEVVSDCVCDGSCHSKHEIKGESKIKTALKYGMIDLPRDIGRALLIGLIVAGLISTFIPPDFFKGILEPGIFSMVVMMLIGIPVYICATSSVPVAAAMITAGISPGAALVYLMTGAATNAATIAVIWRTMGRRTTYIYLGSVILTALFSGTLLDLIYEHTQTTAHIHEHSLLPEWFKSLSAVVLLGILVFVLTVKPKPKEIPMEKNDKETMKIKVSGMTCTHCQNAVQKAILSTKGVENASVDLKGGIATVYGKDFDFNEIKKAIEELGYTVEVKL